MGGEDWADGVGVACASAMLGSGCSGAGVSLVVNSLEVNIVWAGGDVDVVLGLGCALVRNVDMTIVGSVWLGGEWK